MVRECSEGTLAKRAIDPSLFDRLKARAVLATNDGVRAYNYDDLNRLTSIGSLYYGYNGDNKRVMAYNNANPTYPVATLNLYGPDGRRLSAFTYQYTGTIWQIQCCTNTATNVATNVATNYLYLKGKPLNYTDDPVGSNATAAQYFPYGQVQSGSTPVETQAFGSYVADGLGLLYADQRYYYQNWARFLTADGSSANVDLTRSITWNHYVYTNGDPVNSNDPTGADTNCGPDLAWDGEGCTEGPGSAAPVGVINGAEPVYDSGATFTVQVDGNAGQIGGPFAGIFSGPDSVGSVLSGDGTFFGSVDGLLTLASGGVAIAGTTAAVAMAGTEGLATGAAVTAGAAETPEGQQVGVDVGTTVYRVFGGTSGPFGASWTDVDPTTVSNYANVGGLPVGNTGQFMITGTINDMSGVSTTIASPIGNNLGGLFEVVVPNAVCQITVLCVMGLNPPLGGRP